MLHAAQLVLPHPTSGAALRVSCSPPPDFAALADAIAAGDAKATGAPPWECVESRDESAP